MNSSEKTAYLEQLHEYLEKSGSYYIFEDLMESLLLSKPKDPLQFLIDRLKTPPSNRYSFQQD